MARTKKTGAHRAKEPSADESVTWLLGFLQRDVEKIRSGELMDVSEDALRYLPFAVGAHVDDNASLTATGADRDDWPRGPLRELQETLRAGMAQLHQGNEWSPFAGPTAAPQWTLRRRSDGTVQRRYTSPDTMTLLVATAVDLLVQYWPQIRRCQYSACPHFFLPGHGRQQYHDPKCSGLARWQKVKPKRRYKDELVRSNESANRRAATKAIKGKK